MKYSFIIIFSFVTGVFFSQAQIIPQPNQYEDLYNGDTLFFSNIHINPLGISAEEIEVAQSWFSKTFPHRSKEMDKKLHIQFIQTNGNKGLDFYDIDLVSDTLFVTHFSQASKLYAVSSIIQLIQTKDEQLFITPFRIRDYATFPWRGQHLDVCRHFFTVEEVKQHIDLMAFYKFNVFHWHLTDDQAWRIEIKKYPRLTEVGGFRDSTLIGPYVTNPTNWDLTPKYGGFYTQEQIKEVVRYAHARNVTIVPEIEMPGHARAALAAYPELGCTGKRPPLIGYWGVFDEIFCSNEKTIAFLQDVLSEVLELFPSEYIHIGGDEAPKTQWKACEVCQHTIRNNKLKDEHELQSWFVRQMDDFLTKNGRKLIGWDEILEGGLSPNAAVMSWQGFKGGIAAAEINHEVVMTPTDYCYFDYYQGDRQVEPHSIGGNVTLEKVYSFNPIPDELKTIFHKHIKGAQANLWTEYINTYDHVQYMMYPRALALITNLWTNAKVKPEYYEFVQKVEGRHFDLLKNWNVNFSTAHANPKFETTLSEMGIIVEAHSNGDYDEIRIDYPNHSDSENPFSSKSNNRFVVQRNKQNGTSKQTVKATELRYNKTIDLTLTFHKGLGLRVDLLTDPHKSFGNNAAIKLVDGNTGTRPRNNKYWVGFQSNEIAMKVNLDPKLKYSAVTLSMLNNTESWIHLPKKVKLLASKKGKKWKFIEIANVTSEQCKMNFSSKYKFLKLVVISDETIPQGMPGEGTLPFTFIDEIILE